MSVLTVHLEQVTNNELAQPDPTLNGPEIQNGCLTATKTMKSAKQKSFLQSNFCKCSKGRCKLANIPYTIACISRGDPSLCDQVTGVVIDELE